MTMSSLLSSLLFCWDSEFFCFDCLLDLVLRLDELDLKMSSDVSTVSSLESCLPFCSTILTSASSVSINQNHAINEIFFFINKREKKCWTIIITVQGSENIKIYFYLSLAFLNRTFTNIFISIQPQNEDKLC